MIGNYGPKTLRLRRRCKSRTAISPISGTSPTHCHVTRRCPSSTDNAPYFAAFVASSCRMRAKVVTVRARHGWAIQDETFTELSDPISTAIKPPTTSPDPWARECNSLPTEAGSINRVRRASAADAELIQRVEHQRRSAGLRALSTSRSAASGQVERLARREGGALRNMPRSMAGQSTAIGRGKLVPQGLAKFGTARDRRRRFARRCRRNAPRWREAPPQSEPGPWSPAANAPPLTFFLFRRASSQSEMALASKTAKKAPMEANLKPAMSCRRQPSSANCGPRKRDPNITTNGGSRR